MGISEAEILVVKKLARSFLKAGSLVKGRVEGRRREAEVNTPASITDVRRRASRAAWSGEVDESLGEGWGRDSSLERIRRESR